MASAGISGNFSSHSFRIGAATVAGRNGIPDHLIQELGRWKSNAFQSYLRTPSAALASLSQKLVWLAFACQGGLRSPSSPAGVSFSLALRPSLTGRLVFFGSPLWHQAICYWGLAVLGVSWEGSEVPCCPTIGNLRSPSPGEDEWFRLAGVPWRPPRGAWITSGPSPLTFKAPVPKLINWRWV